VKLPATRAEARMLGLTRYFTGKPCPKGHIAPRRVFRADCEECSKMAIKRWQENNYDRVLELGRLEYRRNLVKRKANIKKFHEKNPEYRRIYREKTRDRHPIYLKRYAERYPEKMALKWRNAGARRRGAGGKFSKDDISHILRMQRGRCAYCRNKLGKKYHVDHIQAVSCGGTNHRSNIQITCATCNLSKRNRDPIDFAQSRGLLL